MSKDVQIVLLGFLVGVLLFVVWLQIIGGSAEPKFQTSEYACGENIIEAITSILYENKQSIKGVIQGEEHLRIECPKCKDGAYIDMKTDEMNFGCFIPMGPNSEWHCAKCRYPLGTDWKIIKNDEK